MEIATYKPTLGFMLLNLDLNLRRLDQMILESRGDRATKLADVYARMSQIRDDLEEIEGQ